MAESEDHFYGRGIAEGGYEARALGHSILTQGENLEELRKMVCAAVACHFGEENKPAVIRLQARSFPA